MKLTLLHLSDLHYQDSKDKILKTVLSSLLKDLSILKDKHNLTPDLVLFTGDLINKGENGKSDFNSAYKFFITPLLKSLNLEDRYFFMAPGNHEVDWTKISDTFEKGIEAKLSDETTFNQYYQHLESFPEDVKILRRKLNTFYVFKSKLHNKTFNVASSPFYETYVLDLHNLKIGIVSLNSVWRSSNIGSDENRLILGEPVFNDAIKSIDKCDLKIALSHHGFDMLAPWDSKSVKLAMAKHVDLLCTGHIHDSDFLYVQQILGNLYISTCASLHSERVKNGYSVLAWIPMLVF